MFYPQYAGANAAANPIQSSSVRFSFENRRQSSLHRGPFYSWENRGVLIIDEKYPTMEHISTEKKNTQEEDLADQIQNSLSLNPFQWLDCGNCHVANVSQGSDDWHKTRFGRVGMSKLGAALGLSTFKEDTPQDLLLDVTGIKKKTFTEEEMIRMSYGTQFEPEARKWYERTNNVIAAEYGTFIPKFEPFLNYSSDGIIKTSSGMRAIEIKCVKKMYGKLETYQSLKTRGYAPKIRDYMWPTQYAQCQGSLLITGYEFIDFIVFCPNEQKVFLETVTFDEEYWNCYFPVLNSFLNNELKPLVEKYGLREKMLFP